MKNILKETLIILFIYVLFILYLLLVSNKVEAIENNSSNTLKNVGIKVIK